MSPFEAWQGIILIVTSALLLYAAWTDFNEYRIRNELVIALALLFVLYVTVSTAWNVLLWHAAFAAIMLIVMFIIYTMGWMGGGDVKILAVAFLWTGTIYALPFALLLAVFGTLHTFAAQRGWLPSLKSEKNMRIPLGPSVAGALIVTLGFSSAFGANLGNLASSLARILNTYWY